MTKKNFFFLTSKNPRSLSFIHTDVRIGWMQDAFEPVEDMLLWAGAPAYVSSLRSHGNHADTQEKQISSFLQCVWPRSSLLQILKRKEPLLSLISHAQVPPNLRFFLTR